MTSARAHLPLAVLFGCMLFVGVTSANQDDQREWVTGFEKVGGSCLPVGGLAKPGELPFPFKTMDECEKNKHSAKFNNNLQRWEGFVLDNGKCFKVWARSVYNPFSLSTKSQCDKERKETKTALVALEGEGRVKRAASDLDTGKFVVELLLVSLSLVNPAFAIFIPFLNFLWPTSKTNKWEKERAQVKELINQKMNEAYANDLKDYLKVLKREMQNYESYADTSSQKMPKLIALDTNLGLKELKFMNKKDPISTLAYYTTYVSTRFVVKQELIRIAKPEERQQHAREFLNLAMRHTPYLGSIAYGKFETWRRSKLKCYMTRKYVLRNRYSNEFNWKDEVTGKHRSTVKPSPHNTDAKMKVWCKQLDGPAVRSMNAYIEALRANIRAWGTMFNKMASNPLVTGVSAVDSKVTVDGRKCKVSFTYKRKRYTKCTNAGTNTRKPWCYTIKKANGKNWGYCFSAKKLNIDLNLCQMSTTYNEQYFGHRNKGDNGKLCKPWTAHAQKYTSTYFPMDGNSVALAGNYCRRVSSQNSKPWCYTKSGGWSYCTIRACGSRDWD